MKNQHTRKKSETGNEFPWLLSHGMPVLFALVDLLPGVAGTSFTSAERDWFSGRACWYFPKLLICIHLGFHGQHSSHHGILDSAPRFMFLQALTLKTNHLPLERVSSFLQKVQIVLKMAVEDFTQFIKRTNLDCRAKFSLKHNQPLHVFFCLSKSNLKPILNFHWVFSLFITVEKLWLLEIYLYLPLY